MLFDHCFDSKSNVTLTRAKGVDPVVAILITRCHQIQSVLLALLCVADLQRCPACTVRTVEGVVFYLWATKDCRLHHSHRTYTYAPSLLAALKQKPLISHFFINL